MTLISLVCFIIFTVMLLTFLIKGTDVFSPARIFILVWSLAVGLAELKLSRFQLQWSSYSWLMIMLFVCSTLTGMFVVYVSNSAKQINSVESMRKHFVNLDLNHSRLYYITLFLFICYIISFVVTSIVEGYIPFFTFAPDTTRSQWGIFGFGLFIQIVPALIYLIMLYYLIVKGQRLKKTILGVALFFTFITYLLILQRFYLVFCIILTIVFAYYTSRRINTKNVIITLVLIVIVFYGISAIRTSRYLINIVHYISDMKYSARYALFTEPYMYIVMNLENFSNAVNKLEMFDYGYNTFDFILALSGLKHLLHEYTNIKDFPFIISSSFNTYTMFFAYYKDFGIIGLSVFSFIFGVIISHFYYTMRLKPTINSISVYGIFVFVIFFSFFIPILSWLHFIFNLLVIFLVTKVIANNNTVP